MNGTVITSAFSVASTSESARNILKLQQSQLRITINDTSNAWCRSLKDRLEKLIQLPMGWDGYRAHPVSFATAVFALGMLERLHFPNLSPPELVPGYNGDLQAEWHVGETHIELHVRAPNDVIAWRSTPATEADGEEFPLTNDFTIAGEWIKELADTANAVATAAA